MLNHKENYNSSKVKLITFISFLYGFGLSLSIYILAFYYQEAIKSEKVTIFFFASYFIVFFSLLNLHRIVKKIGKSFSLTSFVSLKLLAILSLLIFWSKPTIFGAVMLVFYIIFSNLSWVMFDVMLESFSIDKLSGRIRGLFLTIANAGLILGPFISLRVLDSHGFGGIFSILLVIDFIIFIFVVSGLQGINHTYNREQSIVSLVKTVWKRKDVMNIYFIAFILHFFYSTMIIYSPMYLKSIGLTLDEIGVIFTIMLVPFVMLQYPAGRLADKKFGEKKMLIFAFCIMALSVAIIFFISSKSVLIWSVVLFATRIGAALVEVLTDSYFYKRIDGTDVEIIDFFRTSKSAAFMSFSLISFIILSFFEIKTVFLLMALIAGIGIFIANRLEENNIESV